MLYQVRVSVADVALAYIIKVAQAAEVSTPTELLQLAIVERAKRSKISVPDQEHLTPGRIEQVFAYDQQRILIDERMSEARGMNPIALTFTIEGPNNNWFKVLLSSEAEDDMNRLLFESIVAFAGKYGIPPPS